MRKYVLLSLCLFGVLPAAAFADESDDKQIAQAACSASTACVNTMVTYIKTVRENLSLQQKVPATTSIPDFTIVVRILGAYENFVYTSPFYGTLDDCKALVKENISYPATCLPTHAPQTLFATP